MENEDYIVDENGQVQWFKTLVEAKNRLQELETGNITQKEDIIETNGDLQLVKNAGVETGWSIINTKTGTKEVFDNLDAARLVLKNSFSIEEDLDSTEDELDDSDFEIIANEDKGLDYKPGRKKYIITKKDILNIVKAVRSTVFGETLDVSTILQAYDNVYISQAKQKNSEDYSSDELEEDYEVIGTNVHHLHFSSFFKMVTDKGGIVKNTSGLNMTSEEALALDTQKYGWEGITIQLPGSNDNVDVYRKVGNAYFTIREGFIKINGQEVDTTTDDFFQTLTGTKIIEQSGGNSTFKIAYSLDNSGSTFKPLKSNFKHPMGRPSEIASKDLTRKDKVSFHYDEKLEYNQQLGAKNTETYFKNAVIVVKHKGKVIGYLKAAGRSDEALLALRSSVILKKEKNPKSIAPTALLKMVLPGSLKLTLGTDGEVNWTQIVKGENDTQISSYGFVECKGIKSTGRPDNAYTTENKEIGKLTLTHLRDITKNLKKGERVYYAVIRHTGRNYAIPIRTTDNLKGEKPSELKKALTALSTLTELSLSERDVKKINSLLEDHNKRNPKNTIPLVKDLDNLKSRIRDFKAQKGSFFNKTDAKKDSVWEALKKTEKTIPLDLNNTSAFHSPKPVIDFTTFSIGAISNSNKVSKSSQSKIENSEKECKK